MMDEPSEAGRWPQPLMQIVIFAVAVIGIAVLYAQYLRRTSMFFPDRYPSGYWDRSAFEVRPTDHTFRTADGVTLHAWLFRASDPHAPLMIWFHGNGGNLTYRAEMAAGFASRGVSVFLFDWRGYGRSEGKPSEAKLFLDSRAAYDYGATLGAGSIAVYGESLGGPYAARVAKERKVSSAVIENSFPSLRDLGNALYSPLPLGWTSPRALRTADWLNEAGVPVLVMHGRRDAVIPFGQGQRLYDLLRVEKEILISESAGHSEIPAVEGERYYATVVRFVSQHR